MTTAITPQTIQTVRRLHDILLDWIKEHDEGMTISELATKGSISRTRVYELVKSGYIKQVGALYRPGIMPSSDSITVTTTSPVGTSSSGDVLSQMLECLDELVSIGHRQMNLTVGGNSPKSGAINTKRDDIMDKLIEEVKALKLDWKGVTERVGSTILHKTKIEDLPKIELVIMWMQLEYRIRHYKEPKESD